MRRAYATHQLARDRLALPAVLVALLAERGGEVVVSILVDVCAVFSFRRRLRRTRYRRALFIVVARCFACVCLFVVVRCFAFICIFLVSRVRVFVVVLLYELPAGCPDAVIFRVRYAVRLLAQGRRAGPRVSARARKKEQGRVPDVDVVFARRDVLLGKVVVSIPFALVLGIDV
jgi:hypothetical protein